MIGRYKNLYRGLIGAYPAKQDLYVERSPIYFTEKLATPVIFFQGLHSEFYFYSRVFGFEPADEIEAITIFNLIKDS